MQKTTRTRRARTLKVRLGSHDLEDLGTAARATEGSLAECVGATALPAMRLALSEDAET